MSISWTKFLFTFGIVLSLNTWAHSENAQEPDENFADKPQATSMPPNLESEQNQNFQDYGYDSLFRTILEFPVYSFYLGAPDVNGMAYVPNFSPRLGAQYSIKELGLAASIALPLPPEEVTRRGNTDQLNFLINKYWRADGVDLFFQNYRGFYIASPWTELRLNKPERYPQLPDAEIIHYGFNYYHVMEAKDYSLKAAYSQMEIQKSSGGSFIWTAFFDHLELSRGEKFISGSEANDTNRIPDIKAVKLNTGGAGIGYGYTYIFEDFQLSAQVLAGSGIQSQKIEEDGSNTNENIQIAFKGNLNASLGYRYKNYSIGAKVLLDTLLSDVKGTHIYSSLLNGILFIGSRF